MVTVLGIFDLKCLKTQNEIKLTLHNATTVYTHCTDLKVPHKTFHMSYMTIYFTWCMNMAILSNNISQGNGAKVSSLTITALHIC